MLSRLKRYKIINITSLVLFIFLWIWLLFTIYSLLGNSNGNLKGLHTRLLYICYFLILDSIILAVSIYIWFDEVKSKFIKTNRIKNEKDSIILSLQTEIENQRVQLENMTFLLNKAIESDKIRTEFFSNISHELKTPLSIILGAIQLIDKSYPVDSDRRKSGKHNRTIKKNCYRLIRLINNILDITKLDSGFLKVNLTYCNLVYLIEEITQSVTPYAEQKGIYVEFDTEYEEVYTGIDIDKFERIILNLLSNAIKFTPAGGNVKVYVGLREAKIKISVKDTGLGIPEDMQKVIFDRFKQANSHLTKDIEGTGIGLSLVKSFVELHNGTISVRSELNKGSEFTIELPVNELPENHEHDHRETKVQNKIIEAINIEFSDIYSIAS